MAKIMSFLQGSNLRPSAYKAGALSAELRKLEKKEARLSKALQAPTHRLLLHAAVVRVLASSIGRLSLDCEPDDFGLLGAQERIRTVDLLLGRQPL